MKLKPRIPAARLFRSAARHEANFYRPFFAAGRILGQRAQHIAEGQQPSASPRAPRALHISRPDGWRYALATMAIVGFCGFTAAQGDIGALMLLPIAAVPGALAYAGLRPRKR